MSKNHQFYFFVDAMLIQVNNRVGIFKYLFGMNVGNMPILQMDAPGSADKNDAKKNSTIIYSSNN
jgi:hypothetical protein